MSRQPWQKARLEVLTRARNLVHHLHECFTSKEAHYRETIWSIQHDTASITSKDYENTAMLRVYTDLVYDRLLPEDFRERLGVILVHGLVGLTQHSWLCVEGNVREVGAEPDRCEALVRTIHRSSAGLLYWRVIVDICAPEIEPSIILIAPTSPLMPQYTEQERFTEPVDYSEIILAPREGAADESQEDRIMKALIHKHV